MYIPGSVVAFGTGPRHVTKRLSRVPRLLNTPLPTPPNSSAPRIKRRMNTYPKDYVQHHIPVMAVVGLKETIPDPDVPKDGTPHPDAPEDRVPNRRRSSSSSNQLRLRATIAHNLRAVLNSKDTTTLWEAARHSQAPAGSHTNGIPNFRVTFVDNVR